MIMNDNNDDDDMIMTTNEVQSSEWNKPKHDFLYLSLINYDDNDDDDDDDDDNDDDNDNDNDDEVPNTGMEKITRSSNNRNSSMHFPF